MRKMKLLFSALTVVFAIVGLTKMLPYDFVMPITFVCLSVTMFITSKEYKDNGQKPSAMHFMLLGIFLLIVTVYNTVSIIWGV